MRLSDPERRAIKEVVTRLDPDAQIYLFGSRVDYCQRYRSFKR